MKVKEVFEKSVQFLRERNIESPRLETELLVASVLKTDRIGIYLKYEAPLAEPEVAALRELIVRKSKGEPTAYLLGEKYFFGRRFQVGPGVLIPRPETEQIIEEAQEHFKNNPCLGPLNIADLGTGSGCLGITLGLEFAGAKVFMVEKSPLAATYCEKNIQSLVSEEDQSNYQLFKGAVENWQPEGVFQLMVANPPYIDPDDTDVSSTVKKFEPAEALFAADLGLAAISSWLNVVEKYLAHHGVVYFEIGHKQGTEVKKLFDSKKIFKAVEILQDFNKKDRIIKAVKNG